MAEKIEIIFDKATGAAKVEAMGFHGKSCKDATKFLDSLGSKSNTKHKAEFFEETSERQGVKKSLYTAE